MFWNNRLLKKLPLFIIVFGILSGMLCSCKPSGGKNGSNTEETTAINTSEYIKPIYTEIRENLNIPYTSVINEKGEKISLLLDIYAPVGGSAIQRPAIIWVHGGGFSGGSKDGGIEKDFANEFAKRGYVTVNINYRLREKPEADWPGTFRDATADAAAAIDWLAANSEKYGVRKDKIAFAGYSAGAGTVVNLCYRDGQAAKWNKKSVFAVIALASSELWMGRVQESDPPCLLVHGTKDDVVPYSNSQSLANDLSSKNVRNQLYTLPDITHDISPRYNEITDAITQFLYKELTGKDAAINIRKGS